MNRDDRLRGVVIDPARLRIAREKAGWNTEAIAIAVDVSPSNVREHEDGTRRPSYKVLKNYAETYGVAHRWLAGIDEPGRRVPDVC